MNEGALAHRYAKALLLLAQDAGKTDEALKELELLDEVFKQIPKLLPMLSDIIVPRSDRRRVLVDVLEQMSASDLMRRYTRYLLDRERFMLFRSIVRAFRDLQDKAAGLIRAKVVSAAPLEAAATERIEKILSDKTGKTVVANFSEDPELIGGMVIQLGSRVYDGSIAGELKRFQERILKTA